MRCQWCGSSNPATASTCSRCHKDIIAEQTTQDAVDLLESIDATEPEVLCPACGASNFLGTRFCSLCNQPLHPGATWPSEVITPQYTKLSPRPVSPALVWGVLFGLLGTWLIVSVVIAGVATMQKAASSDAAKSTPALTTVTSRVISDDQLPGKAPAVVEEPAVQAPSAIERFKKQRAKERAKERAAAAAAPPVRNKPAASSVIRTPNRYVLPLPSGGRFRSNQYSTRDGLDVGVSHYTVDKRVGDIWKMYDLTAVFSDCFPQNLWPYSSVRSYKGERSDENVVFHRLEINLRDRENCSIAIELRDDPQTAGERTDITVIYTLPRGRSVSLR